MQRWRWVAAGSPGSLKTKLNGMFLKISLNSHFDLKFPTWKLVTSSGPMSSQSASTINRGRPYTPLHSASRSLRGSLPTKVQKNFENYHLFSLYWASSLATGKGD